MRSSVKQHHNERGQQPFSGSGPRTIAAIIPTYRRWPYMVATVRMLLSQTRVPDEIIVVDQTPLDEIPRESQVEFKSLKGAHPAILHLRQDAPRVYQARNLAALRARSDYLLYLDDDIEFGPEFVESYIAALEDPPVDAVVGYHTSPETFGAFSEPPGPALSPEDFAFSFAPRLKQRLEGISYTCGGGVCIRRQAFQAVGGWDEHVLTYGDKDLGIRLFKAGYRIAYDPRPKMVHLAAPLGGTRLPDHRSPWSAWERCVSIHYLAFRHLKGPTFWSKGIFRAARVTFLMQRNAIRPWRWAPEFWGWVKGMCVAWMWSRRGVVSPFVESGHTGATTKS